jgi:RNA ligase (TIGR02306 family)
MGLATIEEILKINPHPNAEKLEIATVLGFTCIVGKGLFEVGEQVLLIQPDTVLPDKPWAEVYKKINKTRVKAAKLRGIWSYGIVEKFSILINSFDWDDVDFVDNLDIGTEISHYLGITKYTTSTSENILNAKGNLPFNIPKTDETNWANIRNLSKYLGQPVDISLKVDGASTSFYYKDGEFGCLSRNLELKLDAPNKYTSHIKNWDLYSKLSEYCDTHKVNLCLRGETYGQGVQNLKNNPHSKLPVDIVFYSVWLIDEMRYAGKGEKHYYMNVCHELGLPYLACLEDEAILTRELIQKYGTELEKVNGQPFEGVVIKGKDFSFKVINKHYDSKK